MREIFRNVGEINVASGLALQSALHLQPGLGVLQNDVHLVKRLIIIVIVHFGRHFLQYYSHRSTDSASVL